MQVCFSAFFSSLLFPLQEARRGRAVMEDGKDRAELLKTLTPTSHGLCLQAEDEQMVCSSCRQPLKHRHPQVLRSSHRKEGVCVMAAGNGGTGLLS